MTPQPYDPSRIQMQRITAALSLTGVFVMAYQLPGALVGWIATTWWIFMTWSGWEEIHSLRCGIDPFKQAPLPADDDSGPATEQSNELP